MERTVAERTGLKLTAVTCYLGEFDYIAGGQKCRQHTWAVTVERSASVQISEHHDFAWIARADGRPLSREVRALIRQHQHHTPEVLDDPWPLAGLVVRSPRLELRPDDDAGLRELALLGARGVHPAEEMPMGTPWTEAPPQQRARGTMQSAWRRRAAIGPESWGLNWLIRYRGEVIGTQLLYADQFATTREVGTGSWLGLPYQGRGFGTEARAAVLQFAFECLGACQARTTSWSDNMASQRINAKLGYRPDGTECEVRRGEATTVTRFLLLREDFGQYRPEWTVDVDGLAPCLPLLGAECRKGE